MCNNNLLEAMALNYLRSMCFSTQQLTATNCYEHTKSFQSVCESCKMLVCDICIRKGHTRHKLTRIDNFVRKGKDVLQLQVESTRIGMQSVEKSVNDELNYTRFIDENCNELMQNIRSSFRPLITALEERERFLLEFVERLHTHRMTVLYEQLSALKGAYIGLVDTSKILQNLAGNAIRMNNVAIAADLVQAQNNIDKCQTIYQANQPQNELYKYYSSEIPDNFINEINQHGKVVLADDVRYNANHPDKLTNECGGKRDATRPKTRKRKAPEMNCDVGIVPSNNFKNIAGGECVADTVKTVSNFKKSLKEEYRADTVKSVSLVSSEECLAVTVKTESSDIGQAVVIVPSNLKKSSSEECPAGTAKTISNGISQNVAIAHSSLKKSTIEECLAVTAKTISGGIGQAVPGWMEKVKTFRCDLPTLAFATKGANDGEVSRPWGVCVNKSGHIFVTDRRNNNVQAFAADGRFLYRFGEKGNAVGEFDAPMGICVDKSGRLIVADKNNHRIQVFSSTGKFLLTFGSLGTKEGQMKFPFGVAVNTNLQIAVADTSNYRIQQFEHNGRFIREIQLGVCTATGYDITPRGLCYTPNGRIIVTDYTSHCLHLVDVENKKIVSTKGAQGVGNLQFNCPSGICCDDEGTIILADSHNQRIKVFNSKLECLWHIDVRPSVNCLKMSHFKETDRTCDVALTRDGRIVFVTELLPAKEVDAASKRFVHVY